jgi:hypothetical protein
VTNSFKPHSWLKGDEQYKISRLYGDTLVLHEITSYGEFALDTYSKQLNPAQTYELKIDYGLSDSEVSRMQDFFDYEPDDELPPIPERKTTSASCTCGVSITYRNATMKMHDSWCDLLKPGFEDGGIFPPAAWRSADDT